MPALARSRDTKVARKMFGEYLFETSESYFPYPVNVTGQVVMLLSLARQDAKTGKE